MDEPNKQPEFVRRHPWSFCVTLMWLLRYIIVIWWICHQNNPYFTGRCSKELSCCLQHMLGDKKVPIIKIKEKDPRQIEFNWRFSSTIYKQLNSKASFWRNFLKRKLKHCLEKVCNTDIIVSHKAKPKV